MAWSSWTKLTQPKSKGGLEFLDFDCFNEAFLAKLAWGLSNNPDILLGRIEGQNVMAGKEF